MHLLLSNLLVLIINNKLFFYFSWLRYPSSVVCNVWVILDSECKWIKCILHYVCVCVSLYNISCWKNASRFNLSILSIFLLVGNVNQLVHLGDSFLIWNLSGFLEHLNPYHSNDWYYWNSHHYFNRYIDTQSWKCPISGNTPIPQYIFCFFVKKFLTHKKCNLLVMSLTLLRSSVGIYTFYAMTLMLEKTNVYHTFIDYNKNCQT